MSRRSTGHRPRYGAPSLWCCHRRSAYGADVSALFLTMLHTRLLGILIMLAVWIRNNLPDRYDANWLKQGGGMFDRSDHTHPPAGRFNTGQKFTFWSVVLGGIALGVSGIFLLFPFAFTDVNGMQLAQTVHATIAVLMVAVIIGHIYIGTLGMEGAFEAMRSGTVDLNFAKEHHSAWVEKKRDAGAAPRPAATPAE